MVVEACTADAILDSSFTEIAPLYFKIVFYYMRLCDVLQVLNPKNAKSAPADWQTPINSGVAPGADHADNHRAEHQVNQQFQNKIDADHSKDHISNDRLPSTGGPCLQIGREQEKQTQQEQAGIDHRADDASGNGAAQHTTAAVGFAAPGDGPIDQAGSQTGQDALAQADQGGQEGIGIPQDRSTGVPPLSAYPNPTLYGERYSFKQKDTLYHNGRGCLPLFSGETVRFGTFQRTQNHFVLRQCPLLDLVDRCPTVSIPFHNLFSVMDYHTLIEIYQLVQRQIL